MGKSPSTGRLSSEAEDIITLGQLLKRSRNEERRRSVDGNVASSLTVREKIQEIQNPDRIRNRSEERKTAQENPEILGFYSCVHLPEIQDSLQTKTSENMPG